MLIKQQEVEIILMINRYQHFAAFITCINRQLQRIEREVMCEYGLKGPHAQCLVIMSCHAGGITVSELSKLCDKDKGGISRAISELEEKGLVKRLSENGNYYRAKLQLTETGKKCADSVNEAAKKAVEIAGLNDQDREIFYNSLDIIARKLQEMNKEGIRSKN